MTCAPDPRPPPGWPAMTSPTPDDTSAAPIHDARLLLAGHATAQIVLDGHVYTLRLTKAGKLILTK
jgi:hemin uptake protein HemP